MSKRHSISTLRKVVDASLAERDIDFAGFARDALEHGMSIEDLTFKVRDMTSVPVSSATVRRWVQGLTAGEVVA